MSSSKDLVVFGCVVGIEDCQEWMEVIFELDPSSIFLLSTDRALVMQEAFGVSSL